MPKLGRLGAILALAVQLLLPAMAVSPASAPAPAVLAQAAALWGDGSLCLIGQGRRSDGGPAPLAHHDACAACCMLHQAAALPPPADGPRLAPRLPVAIAYLAVAHDAVRPRPTSPAQPRAPPAGLIEAA
ncbi:MAG: DUF2946 domain-containing protein [Dongiaceae bacterium]